MVLYPTAALYPPATPTLSPEVAAAYRRAGNNWLHDFCSAADGRIHGAGMVDLRDPDEAMREAQRCVRRLGFRAIGITPEPVTKMALHDPFYDALWAVIADLGVPLAIHQSAGTYTQVGMDYYPNWGDGRGVTAHTIGNMLACASITAGGVLERHPNLRVVFLESGCGWVPFWLDRMSAGTAGGYREKALTGLSMTPIESFRRQCFVSAAPDDPGVGDVVRTLGDGLVVTATDFSHQRGEAMSTPWTTFWASLTFPTKPSARSCGTTRPGSTPSANRPRLAHLAAGRSGHPASHQRGSGHLLCHG